MWRANQLSQIVGASVPDGDSMHRLFWRQYTSLLATSLLSHFQLVVRIDFVPLLLVHAVTSPQPRQISLRFPGKTRECLMHSSHLGMFGTYIQNLDRGPPSPDFPTSVWSNTWFAQALNLPSLVWRSFDHTLPFCSSGSLIEIPLIYFNQTNNDKLQVRCVLLEQMDVLAAQQGPT
jgi:hypothetical protein